MTQKGEYQAVKGIYMDSGKVPRTSASEKLRVRYLERIEGCERAEGTTGYTRDRETEEDKSGAKWLSGRWNGAASDGDGVITSVTENFQYHRPQLLTDRKLAEW